MAIDLQAKSVSDSQKIHNGTLGTGKFNVPLLFTDRATPIPNTKTIQGLYNDTSLTINPETGLWGIGAKINISFHQSDLTIWDGLEDLQRWTVQFTNGAGQDIIAEVNSVGPDRSFGDVLLFCTIVSGHRS